MRQGKWHGRRSAAAGFYCNKKARKHAGHSIIYLSSIIRLPVIAPGAGVFLTGSFRNGRGEKIRTSDPLHPMQVRYQAALRPDTKGADYNRVSDG
jgi:hypothetical protein